MKRITNNSPGLAIGFLFGLSIFLLSCGDGDRYSASVYPNIETFQYEFAPGDSAQIPIKVETFGGRKWSGHVALQMIQGDSILWKHSHEMEVAADQAQQHDFGIVLPEREGSYHLVAELRGFLDQPVKSRRLIEVVKPVGE